MKRLLVALGAIVLFSLPASAQVVGEIQSITVIDSGVACTTAPTACATYSLDSQTGGLTLSVSGTWTGTLTFEASNRGSVWTSVLATNLATGAQATTTTASGLFTITNAGVIAIRARATSAVTGTAVVSAAKGIGFARSWVTSGTFTAGALVTTSGGLNLTVNWGINFNNGWLIPVGTTGQFNFGNTANTIGSQFKVDALPTVGSGFGASPAVIAGSTPLAGAVNVGTGGAATTGVITFGGTAFPSAPFCTYSTTNTNAVTRGTPATTQLTLNSTTAWLASDIVSWHCISSK